MISFKNEIGLGKRIKRRLRKFWCSQMFSCFCANRKKTCHSSESGPLVRSEGTSATTDNLQMLVETLQSQAKDRAFHVQVLHTLLYLTTILEQFSRPCGSFTTNVNCSHYKLDVSKTTSKSLPAAKVSQRSLLPAQGSDRSVSAVYPKGDFSFGLLQKFSHDKAVQSSSEHPSRLIQTQFPNSSSGFDITEFKINLITHMRSLRQDLVTLRQLLVNTEQCYSCRSFEKALCTPDQSRRQFYEAKARAYNFVKFYKLRKVDDKKRHPGTRRNV